MAVLRFEDGMVGTLTSAYYLDRNKQSHLHLWGSDGWLRGRPNDWESLEWYSTHPAERSAPTARSATMPQQTTRSPHITAWLGQPCAAH